MRLRGLGCLAFLVALLVLAGLWLRRGPRLFSPGPLSAQQLRGEPLGGVPNHAALEDRCEACHAPLQTQGLLCLQCHTRIQQEIEQQELHSRFARPLACRECHPDHRGRDADMLRTAWERLDHDLTGFSLRKHRLNYDRGPLLCQDCHTSWPVDDPLASVVPQCRTCHTQADPDFMARHVAAFSDRCLECHDGVDRMTTFDHAATRFPLEGAHAQARCESCHEGGRFEGTPTACQACHQEPEVHRGLFPSTCADCHTPQAWTPARLDGRPFDHGATGFSLVRHRQDPVTGQAITCLNCHAREGLAFLPESCVQCHRQRDARFMDQHLATYGPACLQCHDGVDRMADFDHAQVFPLEGAHARLECQACHRQFRFRGTPRECRQCHTEPDFHRGLFGQQCQYCHTSQAWTPARLRLHPFPLEHGGNPATNCAVCHPGNRYVRYTCYGCHEHTPEGIRRTHLAAGVSETELPQCIACHPQGE